MKTLFALTALLSTLSAPAFAYTAEQAAKVMTQANVQEALADQNIASITDGPSYRCMGCYGLVIKTRASGENASAVYNVQVMDFAGRFHVSIAKIKTGSDQE